MRLILAEPQALVRIALTRLIEQNAKVEIIGEAADGQHLLAQVGRLHPDVVITEVNLPQMSGLEALAQIRRHYPEVAVLMLVTDRFVKLSRVV